MLDPVEWPHPRSAAPLSRCAVPGCKAERGTEHRGGELYERRWCASHADAYDVECLRRRADAPVLDILTGERIR